MGIRKEKPQEENAQRKQRRKIAVPDVYVIIFSFLVLAFIAAYILPSGAYERVEEDGITQIVPNSYQFTEPDAVTLLDAFSAIPRGVVDSADIIFLILTVGGVVAIIESTGAINAGINSLIKKTKGNISAIIITFCLIFATISSIGITVNAIIAFVPIGILIARSLKLDPVVAVAMTFLGAYAGWSGGVFDPTVTILGQQIAELPLFSGYMFRIAIFVAFVTVTILYILRYAKKVRNNPGKSLMGANPFSHLSLEEDKIDQKETFTLKHMIILIIFLLTIGFYVFGALNFDWGINELSAIFIGLGIVIALIGKINPNEYVRQFMSGAHLVMYGALVVGMARAVVILLEDGQVIDTIVNSVTYLLGDFPAVISMVILYIFNFIFNGLITSGSGQAAIVMPIMVPIGDMLEATRQTTFVTFKLGDAVSNIITPLSGTLMACLAIAKVSYVKWLKFVLPITIIWIIMGAIFVVIANLINLGPY
ncbi:YfcC family protein [Salicibibacter cibi]|uniref:YfcC family protein n=2 Tax=Salicibibacter cibi TaxID=2743001 RepID=A0A7T6ZE71_9BACI|nr:YfcC family protein [Salicibibacter cibi]